MPDGRLDKDLITDTARYDMLVRVGDVYVDVVIYSVLADNTLLYRSFPLPLTSAQSPVRALEEVVYDNPLMLADFRKVYILLDTPDYCMIPSGLDDTQSARIFTALHPAYAGTVRTASTSTRNASVVFGIPDDLSGFIRRTFIGAVVMPHILPLVRYFASKPGRGNSRRMICNLRPGAMDIIVIDGNRLVQANTIRFRNPADAVYYILAARSAHGLDPHADELSLAGDQRLRDELIPMLRTYLARVMPVIFPPQMFRAGKDSMLAPFDLIVTPLCE